MTDCNMGYDQSLEQIQNLFFLWRTLKRHIEGSTIWKPKKKKKTKELRLQMLNLFGFFCPKTCTQYSSHHYGEKEMRSDLFITSTDLFMLLMCLFFHRYNITNNLCITATIISGVIYMNNTTYIFIWNLRFIHFLLLPYWLDYLAEEILYLNKPFLVK